MKTFQLVLVLLFLFLLFFQGCVVNVIESFPAGAPAAAASPSLIKLIIGGLLAIYEILVRIIPTVTNYSVVAWIIKILKFVSDALNNKKGSANS